MGNPRNNEWIVSSRSRFNIGEMLIDIMQIVNYLLKIHKTKMGHNPF